MLTLETHVMESVMKHKVLAVVVLLLAKRDSGSLSLMRKRKTDLIPLFINELDIFSYLFIKV